MTTTPKQYLGKEGKMCTQFMPSIKNDVHETCESCRSYICSTDSCCSHCESWSVRRWKKAQISTDKLSLKHERKRKSHEVSPLPLFQAFLVLILYQHQYQNVHLGVVMSMTSLQAVQLKKLMQ